MKRNNMCPFCYIRNLLVGAKKVAAVPEIEKYETGVRRTPLMGWSSWNTFRNHIDEDLILEMAEAMKEKGLLDAGYSYVNLDDCWQSNVRDENGDLQGDLATFPSGIKPLVEKINAMGFKLGLYSSNGTLTCEDLPASLGRERQDAQTLAEWGVEYFKYDFCHNVPLSSYAPLIWAVTVTEKGEKQGQRYLCSNAVLEGLARFMPDKGLEGKRYVSGLDAGKGKMVFKNVFARKSGDYVLTLNIKKHGRYPKFVIAEVNGTPYEINFPDQKHFQHTARFQTVVRLEEGNNEIKLYNPVASGKDSAILQYRKMAYALKAATKNVAEKRNAPEKPILFSICEWGFRKPWLWGDTAGNMWRTTPDIRPIWPWIKLIYSRNVKLFERSSAGHFNDPDMLEVGNGKLSYDRNMSHFALWCFMNAPLVLGNDVRKMPDNVLEIITNKSLININQDELCKQAKRVKKGRVDVLAKPLAGGKTAVLFFNKSGVKKKISFNLETLKKDAYVSAKFDAENPSVTPVFGAVEANGKVVSATLEKCASAAFIVE